MLNKREFYKITMVSAAMILMLVNIVGAAPFAYVPNFGDNTTTIFDTATKTVATTVPVGHGPFGAAVSCTDAYVTNYADWTVSVIDTATNVPIAIVPVGGYPMGIAVTPDGTQVYVANNNDGTVSAIDTATNTVIATITVGVYPFGVAVTPDGSNVYVTNSGDNTVSVINTTNNTVVGNPITVGSDPQGVVVSPDGTTAYVANSGTYNTTGVSNGDGTISVINTATNTVTATVNYQTGFEPIGIAISPDGKTVYVADEYWWGVFVMDTVTNAFTNIVYLAAEPYGISVAPDGTEVYVANPLTTSNGSGNTVTVIKTATNTAEGAVYVGSVPYSLGQFIQPAGCCPGCPTHRPHKPFEITLRTDPTTQSVDLLKFPVGDDCMVFPFGNKH